MKTLAMIMTLAAGLASFGLAASAENANKQPKQQTTRPAQASTVTMTGTSAFLPMSDAKQPAWVTYGSSRQ